MSKRNNFRYIQKSVDFDMKVTDLKTPEKFENCKFYMLMSFWHFMLMSFWHFMLMSFLHFASPLFLFQIKILQQ